MTLKDVVYVVVLGLLLYLMVWFPRHNRNQADQAQKNRPLSDTQKALLVLVLSKETRRWLIANDPMALTQALAALDSGAPSWTEIVLPEILAELQPFRGYPHNRANDEPVIGTESS